MRLFIGIVILFLSNSAEVRAEDSTWLVVPTDQRHVVDVGKESSGTEVKCPDNMVMVGRWHNGDENGPTKYECAGLTLYNPFTESTKKAKFRIEDREFSHSCNKESSCSYVADGNRVFTGRWHIGDENGPTKYETGLVTVNGQRTVVNSPKQGPKFKESSGQWWRSGSLEVMVGRGHWGDENGSTSYHAASIVWKEK